MKKQILSYQFTVAKRNGELALNSSRRRTASANKRALAAICCASLGQNIDNLNVHRQTTQHVDLERTYGRTRNDQIIKLPNIAKTIVYHVRTAQLQTHTYIHVCYRYV